MPQNNIINLREMFTEEIGWVCKEITVKNTNGVNITYTPITFNSDEFKTKEKPSSIYVKKSINDFTVEYFDVDPSDPLFEELLEEKTIPFVYNEDKNIELPDDTYWEIEWSKYWYKDGFFYTLGREGYYEYEDGEVESLHLDEFRSTLKDVVKRHLINYSDWDELKEGKKKLSRIVPVPDNRIGKCYEQVFVAHDETLPIKNNPNIFIKYIDRDDDNHIRFNILVNIDGELVVSGEIKTINNSSDLCQMTGRKDLYTNGKLEMIWIRTTGVISAVNPETNETTLLPVMFDKGVKMVYNNGKWLPLIESKFIDWDLYECKFVKE